MTTKPKPRKTPPAGADVNPKLAAIAAKLDETHRRARLIATGDDWEAECRKIWALDKKLARVRATSLEALKLKARFADIVSGDNLVAYSIVRDLRALSPPRPREIQP